MRIALGRAGRASVVRLTRGPGDAGRFASECRDSGLGAIIVVGGDGTVHDVVSSLGGHGPPVLVVPAGTENILAKYLRTRRDAEWLTQVLLGGRTLRFDAASVNGRRFLLIAGMGFDAEIVRRVTVARRGHIDYASYFWPVWRTLWSHRHPPMRVEADGALIAEGPSLAFVGLVPRYAMGLRICDRARPDDGMLDVCLLRCPSRPLVFRHAINVALGRHLRTAGVAYRQAKQVRIVVEQTTGLEVDGEWGGMIPAGGEAVFEIVPEAARFLVSRDWMP